MSVIAWRKTLSRVDQRRVTSLIDAATAHDGTAPVGDQVRRELAGDRTGHLVAEDGDEFVGYLGLARVGQEAAAMAEVVVHPAARRRGIGSELIRAGLAEGGAGARVWAHGNLGSAKAVAAALDLVAARELLQMRRLLSDLPSVWVPDGVRIRTYEGSADDAELLRVNNAAFAWHPEQGSWAIADVAERRGEAWFDPAGLFLAFDAGGQERSDRGIGMATGPLLGFHWTKVHGPSLGEVYVVGVDPGAQGRGLGASLTLVGLHHLAERLGATSAVMLYVEADNTAAVTTYERLGFEVCSVDVAYSFD